MNRALDAIGAGLVAVAVSSIVGIAVALHFDSAETAWKFLSALVGSGSTLIVLNIFEQRLYG